MILTKPQRKSLAALWKLSGVASYRTFRRSVFPYPGDDGCVMVPYCGMLVGIERDGYAHS